MGRRGGQRDVIQTIVPYTYVMISEQHGYLIIFFRVSTLPVVVVGLYKTVFYSNYIIIGQFR
jgi:hypothetical protein